MGNTPAKGNFPIVPQRVEYSGSEGDELKNGYLVCYVDGSEYQVEKPSFANIDRVAGIVTNQRTKGTVDASGLQKIGIAPIAGAAHHPGIEVFTDENVADLDILGAFPGFFEAKKYVGLGKPILRAMEAQDRSTTSGVVACDFGLSIIDAAELRKKVVIFSEDFIRPPGIGVSGLSQWVQTVVEVGTGTSEFTSRNDRAGGGGELLTAANDNDGINVQLNGLGFKLDKSCYFEIRQLELSTAVECEFFAGLSIVDTTIVASNPADLIGFLTLVDADLMAIAAKSSTGAAVDTLTDMADAVAVDLAFYHDRVNDTITFYINDVAVAAANAPVAANVPDDVLMTLSLALLKNAAGADNMRFDSILLGNYLA